MSINMSVNVRWSIILNATGEEWHTFQHAIAAKMEKAFAYEFSDGKFRRFFVIADGEREFEVWARRDKYADFQFAIFPKAYIEAD